MKTKVILTIVTSDVSVDKICNSVHIKPKEIKSIKGYHNNAIMGEKATVIAFSSPKLQFSEQLEDILRAGEEISNFHCDSHIVCYLIRDDNTNPVEHWVFTPALLRQMAKTGIEINLIYNDIINTVVSPVGVQQPQTSVQPNAEAPL
jgi:hypothetical protein